MALRLRRGTNAERATRVFDLAEPVWVTDKQQLWIGNGTGSVDPIQSYAGTGLTYSYNSTNGGRLSVNLGALNTDQLPQGGTNKYFSNQAAQDAFAELLSNGTQTGISFTYNPITHALDASVTDQIGILSVADDSTPQLGGNLDLDGNDITGTGDINYTGNFTVAKNTFGVKIEPSTAYGSFVQSLKEELILEGETNFGTSVRVNLKSAATVGGSILSAVTSLHSLELRAYKNGFLAPNPGDVAAGDVLGILSFAGYMNSTQSVIPCALGVQADPSGTLTGTHIPSKFFILGQPATSGGSPALLTFDSRGRLAINQENAVATLDINGFAKLAILTAAPASPSNGMIAIADGTSWNPLSMPGKQQMVAYLGGGWREMSVEP